MDIFIHCLDILLNTNIFIQYITFCSLKIHVIHSVADIY